MPTQLLVSKQDAAAALGVSLRTIENLLAVRELKSVRVGRRRMIPSIELQRFARRDHATRSATVAETPDEQRRSDS
jgi:excisionase family DNA binding protein